VTIFAVAKKGANMSRRHVIWAIAPLAAVCLYTQAPTLPSDDTAKVQALIDAGKASNLPCGNYRVRTLHLPGKGPNDGVDFSGANNPGWCVILTSTTRAPVIVVDQPMYSSGIRRFHVYGDTRIDSNVSHFTIEHNRLNGAILLGPKGSIINGFIRENLSLGGPGGDSVIYADPASNLIDVDVVHNWFQSPYAHYVHLTMHTVDRCQGIHFRYNVYEGPKLTVPVVIGGCANVSSEFEHWADFFSAQPMIAEDGGINGTPSDLTIISPQYLSLSPGIPHATVIAGAPFGGAPCAIQDYRLGKWSCIALVTR
jgi:hypothetical protein